VTAKGSVGSFSVNATSRPLTGKSGGRYDRIVRLVLLLVLVAAASLIAEGQKRDVTKYDHIGPYKVVGFASTPKTDQDEGEVRDFLWNHWREHRRGTVTITHQYVEGFVRATYFIEPDRQGRWSVVQYTDNPYRPNIAPRTFRCSIFERVEPDRLHLPLIPIKDSEERPGQKYLLHPVCGTAKNPHLW